MGSVKIWILRSDTSKKIAWNLVYEADKLTRSIDAGQLKGEIKIADSAESLKRVKALLDMWDGASMAITGSWPNSIYTVWCERLRYILSELLNGGKIRGTRGIRIRASKKGFRDGTNIFILSISSLPSKRPCTKIA